MTAEIDRLHALDAVRVIALLLGIVLHGAMSFMMPIPALDSSQSTTLAVAFYVIHIFRMSAFYLIAGFFARMVVERRGVEAFIKDRAKRIVIPMIGLWPVLLALIVPVIIWGTTKTFPEGPPPGLESPEGVFPLLHFWFLYYLVIFYILALGVRAVVENVLDRGGALRKAVDSAVRVVVSSYFAPVLLAVPIFWILYSDPAWIPWAGIPTPDQGLDPKVPALVGFGTAFGLGWLVHRQIGLLQEWRKRWIPHLAIAVGLSVVCLSIGGVEFDLMNPDRTTLMVVPGPEYMRIVYAACYTMAVFYWSFALVGVCISFFSTASARWRYVADSSYWLYLMHVPVLWFFAVVVSDWPLHWSIKFPLIMAVSVYVLLLSYRYWVRGTWIGALLNGRRRPPLTESTPPATTAEV